MTKADRKFLNTKDGFTLVEVLVTVGLLVPFVYVAGSLLINSQMAASVSKHRIEAAYAAQQIIETQRQNPFITLGQGTSQTVAPSPSWVILDSKGHYNNTNTNSCNLSNTSIFCGQATITVTPSVYTNNAGQPTTSTTTDHFVVNIYWNENALVHITETYAADIVNDPMLN